MSKFEETITVNLGDNNGTIKFSSFGEVDAFWKKQEDVWKWLAEPPAQGQIGNSAKNTISNQFQQIRSVIGQLESQPEIPPSNFVQVFEHAFNVSRIPIAASPVQEFLTDIRKDDALVAVAALTSWMNLNGLQLQQFRHLKGAMLMAAFDAKITPRTPSAVSSSLKKLGATLQEAHDDTNAELARQKEYFELENTEQRKTVAKAIRSVRKKTTSAIQKVNDTEKLYKEQMKLKGPVEYWSNKASSHNIKSLKYRSWLTWFGAIAGLTLVIALIVIAVISVKSVPAEKPHTYLMLAGIGVVVSTIVFWVARILTRLFLSEHHLAIDAEERAVMTETYLALTAEGQATEQERALVLASLFRPTADGIVRDDAAPDFSPSTILSKIGSR